MANIPYERESALTHAANLIAWALGLSQTTAGRVTDYNAGGIARTMLETVAIRLEHIDSRTFGGLRRAMAKCGYRDVKEFQKVGLVIDR